MTQTWGDSDVLPSSEMSAQGEHHFADVKLMMSQILISQSVYSNLVCLSDFTSSTMCIGHGFESYSLSVIKSFLPSSYHRLSPCQLTCFNLEICSGCPCVRHWHRKHLDLRSEAPWSCTHFFMDRHHNFTLLEAYFENWWRKRKFAGILLTVYRNTFHANC